MNIMANSSDRIPFVDLGPQWEAIRDGLLPEMQRLFETHAYCLGPYAERFEQEVSEFLKVPHAIGVNSGTSALHLATIVAGIGPGDEVLVPAQTFIATAWGVIYAGATPVLCDVERRTGTIDVADAERRITKRTKAIIPVHLFGQPADMKGVMALAERHGLKVIEDAAQAIGASYGGRSIGTIGQTGCFSFYPGKNLGAAGESRLVVTSDDSIAERLRSLRNHGQSVRYRHDEVGYNYRMEGIQALVLSHKLRHIAKWTERRREIAKRYNETLSDLPLQVPHQIHQDHVYHLYILLTERRDALRDHLSAKGIDTGLHYPIPVHAQPCFQRYVPAGAYYPEAQRYGDHCLSLPMFFGLSDAQVGKVIDEVRAFFKG